jgi:Arc/MetJ family transcription regulator
VQYTVYEVMDMRMNIVIDDELMEEAFKMSGGVSTKKELVELALREFVDTRKRRDLRELRGRVAFADEYDYKSMRQ